MRSHYHSFNFIKTAAIFTLMACSLLVKAQSPQHLQRNLANLGNIFYTSTAFIENVGQYGQFLRGYENMDSLLLGYEGMGMPVLFTKKGVIFLQRKADSNNDENFTDRTITMQWVGANSNPLIIKEERTSDYHTYGTIIKKAFGYKKIIYKDLYPSIDLVYSFNNSGKTGFEYTLILNRGADIRLVKMRYGGDVKNIQKNKNGNLQISSDIDTLQETAPLAWYGNKQNISNQSDKIPISFRIDADETGFYFPENVDTFRQIIIDPFISNTGNLDGFNAGKAKDIDFDYDGNVFVTGGGDVTTNHRLAKYDANGVLLWTFNGTLAVPSWEFGQGNGGWVVEKQTGRTYLGRGTRAGFVIRDFIRLNANGLYDNFIIAPTDFFNMWKMLWNCNNGNPRIWAGGGGTITNACYMFFTPPIQAYSFGAITGSTINSQNVADFLFDPQSNDMYTLFACSNGAPVDNYIYKNAAPYNGSTIAWFKPTGFPTLVQQKNRPYLVANPTEDNDNSVNMLALNASYLFYWDGKNLQTFNKTTGAVVGSPLITGNTAKMQGGIFADACNNVFVGWVNGTIKVYNFDGNTFNDAPPDIILPGYPTSSVYDIAYDDSRKLLYACGDGFVTSLDIAAYNCTAGNFFNLNITPDCSTASVVANLVPAPLPGTVVTFTLYNGNTLVSSNSTGIFTGLSASGNYRITATLNEACSGLQLSGDFSLSGPISITTSLSATSCGLNNGQITATGSGTTAPYLYSINGINFFTSGLFTALAPGTYTVTVKDANGCVKVSLPIQIQPSSVPAVSTTSTNASCGLSNGQITATGSGTTPPYSYSIDGINFFTSGLFTALAPGPYTVTVKDANGCTKTSSPVQIQNSSAPIVTATSTNTTCGLANGSVTVAASGGTVPYQYSINGGTSYQTQPVFTGLAAQGYAIIVKDAAGCSKQVSINVNSTPSPLPVVFAGNDTLIRFNTPFQLNAIDVNNAGFIKYEWAPSYGLNNSQIKNPVATLDRDFSYNLLATSINGCTATAKINIKIFTRPDVFVPGAFTPDGNSLNDIFKPSLSDIKILKLFAVYNRYGELVYRTSTPNAGWDGTIKGKKQNAGTYIWFVEAVDYMGRIISKNGTVLLIR